MPGDNKLAAVVFDWDRTYRVTWTSHAPDGSVLMTLELPPVRMPSPTRALLGLSALLLPTELLPYN